MSHARPLPSYLVQRYHGWKATGYADNRVWIATSPRRASNPRDGDLVLRFPRACHLDLRRGSG